MRKRLVRKKDFQIQSMMKYKKSELIAAHKLKHPSDPALYRRSKKEIAKEITRDPWWPVRDFPVTVYDPKNEEKKVVVNKK